MSSHTVHCVRGTEMALYVSYFEIGHNACEFLIDFGQFRPESADAAMHTRIVVGPVHAKLLATMLHEAVLRHEAEHGPIHDLDAAPAPAGQHSTSAR